MPYTTVRTGLTHLLSVVFVWLGHETASAQTPADIAARLKTPPGYAVSVFAQVENPRQMVFADNTLFVGSFKAGRVYALAVNEQWQVSKQRVLMEGVDSPVGVAWKDDALYVSAVHRILRMPGLSKVLKEDAKPVVEVAYDAFPKDRGHGWKFIAFGPDGRLFVPVGAPCNVCEAGDNKYALIGALDVDKRRFEVLAKGIRNSVGFDWQPDTQTLFATSNGRDWLGDDLPPDVLLKVDAPSAHFGFPYCHAGELPDPEFGAKRACSEFSPTFQKLGAHVAALGMRFERGGQFAPQDQKAIYIAEHGSWNRSRKSGYRITQVQLNAEGQAASYQPFIEGWLKNEADGGQRTLGRPADVLFLPDGSMLIADDYAHAIYRVTYTPTDKKVKTR